MELNEYQEVSKRTIPKGDKHKNIANYAMGLSGEAGETTDLIKKYLFHGHHLEIDKVRKELGDVMHYVAGLCTMLNVSLEDVAQQNISKLKSRYPDGFSEEASKNRVL